MSELEKTEDCKVVGKDVEEAPRVMDELHKTRPVRRKFDIKKKAQSSDKKCCLYCHDTIERHEGHAWCPHCKIAMHKDCAEESIACPTLGCKKDLLKYTPLSLTQSPNDGLGVFGFSLGQVMYYVPFITVSIGALIGGLAPGSVFAMLSLGFMLDWALKITQVLDSVVDRIPGRRLKLSIIVFPFLFLAFACFKNFTYARDLYGQLPIPTLVMGMVFFFAALITIIAQLFEPAVLEEPKTKKKDGSTEPLIEARSSESPEDLNQEPVPDDMGSEPFQTEAQEVVQDKASLPMTEEIGRG